MARVQQQNGNRSQPKRKRKKRRMNVKRVLIITLGVLCVAMVGVLAAVLIGNHVPAQADMQVVFDSGMILPNTTINGVDVGNMTPAQARMAIDEQVVQKATSLAVKLQYTDRLDLLASDKIGVFPNADDTIRKAALSGREGGITQRKNAMASATVNALSLSHVYDEAQLEANIRAAASSLDTSPIEPTVSVDPATDQLVVTPGKDGIRLDVDQFVQRVKASVVDGTFGPVAMPGTAVPATYNTADIQANTIKITTAETIYDDAASSGRAMNIKKMCDMLSGSVVLPGESFSVNDKAGARTLANGWYLAKGIENGVYTDQPGGGICQVSSTLYNGLLKADLEIVSRRPHSIPSSYVKHALDATISTGGPDLVFKNNTQWPIYLVLHVDESKGAAKGVKKKMIVDIYGSPIKDGLTIELESLITKTVNFDPLDIVYTDNPDLVRKGRNGYTAEAWKVYKDATGKEVRRVKANTSTYASSKPYELTPVSPSPGTSPAPGTSPSTSPGTVTTPTPAP